MHLPSRSGRPIKRPTAACLRFLLGAAQGAFFAANLPAQALVITPTFDSTITGSVNSGAIQADINGQSGFISPSLPIQSR